LKIYYFSGTGNSFYAARTIAGHFPGASLESIAAHRNGGEVVVGDEELIVVCPIYFYGIPHIAKDFLERLRAADLKYLSLIFTAEYPNGIAVGEVEEICRKRNLAIHSCFYLRMPTNYLIKSKMLSSGEIEAVIERAGKKLERIVHIIRKKKNHREVDSRLYSFIVGARKANTAWVRDFPAFDSGFAASDECNGCRLCEKHCPAGNIEMTDKPA